MLSDSSFQLLHNRKKGFTLAELLVVVAIIAVLVAIAIPIFTSQLEKAREATDAANLRAAYAEVSADAVLNDASSKKEIKVDQKQTQAGWQTTEVKLPFELKKEPANGAVAKYWTVKWDSTKNKVIAE